MLSSSPPGQKQQADTSTARVPYAGVLAAEFHMTGNRIALMATTERHYQL